LTPLLVDDGGAELAAGAALGAIASAVHDRAGDGEGGATSRNQVATPRRGDQVDDAREDARELERDSEEGADRGAIVRV